MIVPLINKQFEKDKLRDLVNNSGLSKSEISKRTKNPPNGYGKISIQTMYDLDTPTPPNKPDAIKLFQLKELLRVIGDEKKQEISLGNFVNPEISKIRIVLEWNHTEGRFETTNLFESSAKAVYFPNWVNLNKDIRAILSTPSNNYYHKTEKENENTFSDIKNRQQRITLFDLSKKNWDVEKPDHLLWRHCLLKIKGKNYYWMVIPHEVLGKGVIKGQQYLGYTYRAGFYNPKKFYWTPTYEGYEKILFDEIYPITTMDISLDAENIIIDLE